MRKLMISQVVNKSVSAGYTSSTRLTARNRADGQFVVRDVRLGRAQFDLPRRDLPRRALMRNPKNIVAACRETPAALSAIV